MSMNNDDEIGRNTLFFIHIMYAIIALSYSYYLCNYLSKKKDQTRSSKIKICIIGIILFIVLLLQEI
jgi:Kef-type K+ transport system membrane component KefB